jgi:hypothetical protein
MREHYSPFSAVVAEPSRVPGRLNEMVELRKMKQELLEKDLGRDH